MSLAQGAGLLAELSEPVQRMEQATSQVVDLVGRLQRAGVVSWGQVRGIVARLRRLPLDDLAAVDARVEASSHTSGY